MLTVTQLAQRFGISRATVLYYEREGLLRPAHRTENGYRWYGDAEMERLRSILAYRSFGLPVTKISDLIERGDRATQGQILRDQFAALEQEIAKLRKQQNAIVKLLEQSDLLENEMINKDRWVEIMRATGLSENDMENWHKQFEKMEPDAHQEFLESLQIDANEIAEIRTWSKGN